MKRIRTIGWSVLLLLAAAGLALAADPVGVVRKSSGSVSVVRSGKGVPASVGMKLLPGDTVETGGDGSVGILLRDDSRLSLGPDSSFALTSFRFSPREGKFALAARLTRGTLEYFSGLIGKLAPDSVRFDTPVSTIGIRGTHFIVKSEPAGGR